ncbi:fatty acid desaturase [Candidatus Woesearchaeota archaeon]|nr:fatty acid desaturase [Candidatus Woesearchaeota archaeon]
MLILSYFYYGIAITGTHETRHNTFVKSRSLNKILAYFFSDFWGGQSNEWWYHRHVKVHHIHTNITEKEEAVFYYPWINKYVYFFILPYLVMFWLLIHSIYFLWGEWKKLFLFLMINLTGWIFHVYLFSLILPLQYAFISVFIMRSLFAPLFMQLAVFNHIGLEDPKTRLPWLSHQTKTTRNLKKHWFLNGIGGNAFVECHIEHHLFPSISNRLLSKIKPLIIKQLKKEGYKYIEESYWDVLTKCLKYYDEIFKNTNIAI